MASFTDDTFAKLAKMYKDLEIETDAMLSEMVIAGATVVKDNMTANMPKNFRDALTSQNIELSKVYKTPSDGGINCQAKIVGYFINRNGVKTPAPLVANMLEYGSTSRKYGKQAFLRASFNRKQIEEAMLQVQKKYISEE